MHVNGRLEHLLIDKDASIRQALLAIEAEHVDSAVMVDESRRLVGLVGERQIHRALLDGLGLDSPVAPLVEPRPPTVLPDDGRAEVLDLMRARSITEVPVVDPDGHVVGVHVCDELLGVVERDNWAVIMAGGRGTRLAPLTDDLPKPMVPVAGRPILERLVLHLVGGGIRRILLSVNYLADQIEQHFGDGSRFGCRIDYLRDDPDCPLGTGGALGLLPRLGLLPEQPLLVMNGDLVTAFGVGDLLAAHREHPVVATMAVSEYRHQVPFGVVEIAQGHLARVVEKPVTSWPVNAGVYVVEPWLLNRVPPDRLYPITALFDDCLRRGQQIGVWRMPDDWQDIGRPAELARARGRL
ncbi:MAG TPA: sugar phosphate nucleotidyltransferase [Mycobacteriales bacterium]|nr:sugar phosphate nucleotidyltransferase [Mycobacteriales bacterium]